MNASSSTARLFLNTLAPRGFATSSRTANRVSPRRAIETEVWIRRLRSIELEHLKTAVSLVLSDSFLIGRDVREAAPTFRSA